MPKLATKQLDPSARYISYLEKNAGRIDSVKAARGAAEVAARLLNEEEKNPEAPGLERLRTSALGFFVEHLAKETRRRVETTVFLTCTQSDGFFVDHGSVKGTDEARDGGGYRSDCWQQIGDAKEANSGILMSTRPGAVAGEDQSLGIALITMLLKQQRTNYLWLEVLGNEDSYDLWHGLKELDLVKRISSAEKKDYINLVEITWLIQSREAGQQSSETGSPVFNWVAHFSKSFQEQLGAHLLEKESRGWGKHFQKDVYLELEKRIGKQIEMSENFLEKKAALARRDAR